MPILDNLKCICGKPVHLGPCGGGGGSEEKKEQDKASEADAISDPDDLYTDKSRTAAISKFSTSSTLRGDQQAKPTAEMAALDQNISASPTDETKTMAVSDPNTSAPSPPQSGSYICASIS